MSGFSRTVSVANLTRQLLSVRTSDVASTSAPQTTCTLLIQTARRLSTVKRAQRDLDGDERDQQRGRTDQFALRAGDATRRVRPSRGSPA